MSAYRDVPLSLDTDVGEQRWLTEVMSGRVHRVDITL